jgi:NAD(P)H-dependent FMN reductase
MKNEKNTKLKLKIILGSTRQGRQGEKVYEWTKKLLTNNKAFETEFLDLKEWNLPFYDFATSPAMGKLEDDLIQKWTKKIAEGDAYIIITPEYNHGYPGVLKNAMDFVYNEWNNKPVAFISYSGGPLGGIRAVEQLRQVVIELQMAPIRNGVHIPAIWQAFDETGNIKTENLAKSAESLFSQLEWWAKTLKAGRTQ